MGSALSVLCPSQRYHAEEGRRPKKLTDYARGMLLQLKRWVPDWTFVVVCDSSFAALELLHAVRGHVTVVTRLRLDAALFEPAPPSRPGQVGRPRKKGQRLPKLDEVLSDPATPWQDVLVSYWYGKQAYRLEVTTGTAVWYHKGMSVVPIRWIVVRDPSGKLDPKAFLCTDVQVQPLDMLSWFVRRWSVEVTFEEIRRHLGMETQRQWSDRAILRTTPSLLGLFSLVTLFADRLAGDGGLTMEQAIWYEKQVPTFSDALASVRKRLWQQAYFGLSQPRTETLQIPKPLYERLTGALCYAA